MKIKFDMASLLGAILLALFFVLVFLGTFALYVMTHSEYPLQIQPQFKIHQEILMGLILVNILH